MIENLFTFVRTLGNQRIEGKKFFTGQVGLLGTLSDGTGSIGTAGKVLSSTGSGTQWVTVGSSNVQDLNDLSDVIITTAAEGNLLRYNGTSWVNWAPNFLTSYGSLNDLSDVTLTTPVNGSRLVYVHSTGQWIDAAPLAVNKIYYGTALGDAASSTVVTNGTRLGVGSLAMPTNLTVGQIDITNGLIGNGSVHIGGVNDNDTYLLASNNKIQVGSQETEVIPGEDGGEEPQSQTTFTPSTLNIQPLGGQTVFGGLVTATGFKTPAGLKKQILLADGTVSSTNGAQSGQILRWIESGGIGQWLADDEGVSGIPSLQDVTDVGSSTTDTITAGGFSTSGSVTAAVVTTPLIEREGVLTINSEEQVDQGDPNPNLLYVSWLGDNKFVVNADGYAIANTGFKVVNGTASGFLKANGTIDTNTYLTSYTETQTLDDVTDLGSTTTNTITVGGIIAPELSYNGLLTINADSTGVLQPEQGDPVVPVLSFEWAGTQQGYIDTDGKITFNGFKTPTGTSSGFLKANGTIDTNAYITGVDYIDDIGDVNLVSPATGDVLMFDGLEWVNGQIQTDYTSKVQHEVKAGVAISKGQAVYVTSADGTNMIVGLASNASEATSSKTMGLALTNAAVNGKFFVVTEGLIDGLNTASATAGQPVWLGTNGNLIFGLNNKPVAPAHLVYLGVVTRANANNGEIFVHVQNGFELNEIHDALITSPTAGQLLRRDVDGLWKNWTPNYITASSSDELTNKRINLSTGLVSAVAIDSIDPFLGQNGIALFQDGFDKGGTINVDEEGGVITISNPGIGYYSGLTTTEGGSRFLVSVAGNTLTGTIAEFNAALTDADFATESYVATQISNLVDSAPATLNTLNELAAALGDDPNFATTVATSIGLKQDQLNGTGFVKANGTTISYDNSTYITSESDPVFVGSAAYNITVESIQSWDEAFGWGNHANAGYLTSVPTHTHSISDVTGLQTALDGKAASSHAHAIADVTGLQTALDGKLSSESDPVFVGSAAYNITTESIQNWDEAFGWGNHANYGYLTSYTETDPTVPTHVKGITTTEKSNWNTAYGWGNHANAGYLTSEADTLATVTSRGATTSTPIIVTAGEGREVAVYLPSSYTTNDLVSGHEYGWYSDHWRLGMTRSAGAAGADFVVQWNGARMLSLTNGGNLTATGIIYATGGNSTNWNSAYGWGNHASAGYLTAEADTLASVTGRGSSTTNGISVGSLSVPSYIYLTNAGANNAFISESWGVNLNGVSTHPVQVRGASLSVGYSLGGGTNYGTNSLYVAGSVGIGTTTPSYKLHVAGNAYINETLYVNQETTIEDNLVVTDGISQNNIVGRPYAVWGASGTTTGAVIIKFPGDTSSYGMVHAVVDIYEYSSNSVSTVIIGGHNWYGAWYNYGANVIGQTDKQVRLAVIDGKYAIVIGDDSSSWSYGQVVLRKIQNGTYYQNSMRVYNGYTASQGSVNSSWISGDLRGLIVPGSLTVNGTITENSSIRYKKDIVDIEGTSERVNLLKPVRYKKIDTSVEEIGLIAEDVAELFPEVVKYDNEGRPDGVNYSRLSVILLKAVQELTERVNKLENK